MDSNNVQKAIIYSRVACAERGGGAAQFEVQEAHCRDFAMANGLPVVAVFRDHIAGTTSARPGIQAMLRFLEAEPEQCVVIVEDLARLARSIVVHFELRAAIEAAGGILKSPAFTFGGDAIDRLSEGLQASVAQHQWQKQGVD